MELYFLVRVQCPSILTVSDFFVICFSDVFGIHFLMNADQTTVHLCILHARSLVFNAATCVLRLYFHSHKYFLFQVCVYDIGPLSKNLVSLIKFDVSKCDLYDFLIRSGETIITQFSFGQFYR